jgi:uncharacterized protein (TIGR03067 family)
VRYAVALLIVGLLPLRLPSADDKPMERELAALKGTWAVVRARGPGGQEPPKDELAGGRVTWTFKDGGKATFSLKVEGKDAEHTYSIDPSRTPKEIDLTYVGPEAGLKGFKQFGIYKLEKDKLTLCLTGDPKATKEDRPKDFEVKDGAGLVLEMERAAKK